MEPMQPPSTFEQITKYLIGIHRFSRAYDGFPPAGLARDGMAARHMLVARERMAHEDGVRALRIQRSIGLVGDLERDKQAAAIERQGFLASKDCANADGAAPRSRPG